MNRDLTTSVPGPDQPSSAATPTATSNGRARRTRSTSARDLPGSAVTQSYLAPLLQVARRNGMFSSLSDTDAEIVMSFCHFSFVGNDVQLFAAGDQADYMLFIADGRVNVTCKSADNQVLRVGTASIGAILGESAITSISQRTSSVTTASLCALGYLYYDDFDRMCLAHPETALRFLIMMFNQMSGRMRSMINMLTEANQMHSSLELLSKVLFDRRIGAPRPTADGVEPIERRANLRLAR